MKDEREGHTKEEMKDKTRKKRRQDERHEKRREEKIKKFREDQDEMCCVCVVEWLFLFFSNLPDPRTISNFTHITGCQLRTRFFLPGNVMFLKIVN